MAWQGQSRRGKAGVAVLGSARRGESGQGKAGKARLQAWQGTLKFIVILNLGRFAAPFYKQESTSMTDKQKQKRIDQEITRIFNRDGCVVASVVLEENTPEGTPLHDLYIWDDAKAAHQQRLDTTRKIIRVARILGPDKRPERPVHVPKATVISESSREGYYTLPSVVVHDVDDYQLALREAIKHVNAAQRTVDALREAADGERSDKLTEIQMFEQAIQTAQLALNKLH